MSIIRNKRGKWCVLSPVYPWKIQDRLKTYDSLLNYVLDDSMTSPHKLSSKRILSYDKKRLIYGMKMLLFQNDQMKNYLHIAPSNLIYENSNHPQLEREYVSVLMNAKNAINKFRIYGEEVIEKRHELELLGAHIENDEAVFDYDASKDLEKIFSIGDTTNLKYIATMLEIYLIMNDNQTPQFFDNMKIINPNIFHSMKRKYGEKIARELTKVNMNDFVEIENLELLLEKIIDMYSYNAGYYIFPQPLHGNIHSNSGIYEYKRIIQYHLENETTHSKYITIILQFFQSITKTTNVDRMKMNIRKEFEDIKDNFRYIENNESDEIFQISTEKELKDMFYDTLIDDDYVFEKPIEKEIMKEIEIVENNDVPIENKDSDVLKQFETNEPVLEVEEPVLETNEKDDPNYIPETTIENPLENTNENVNNTLDFDNKYPLIDEIHGTYTLVEKTNIISPFRESLVIWEDVKYPKGILSVIYNECLKYFTKIDKVYRSTCTSLRNKLYESVVDEKELHDWWKTHGIDLLKRIINSQEYTNKLYGSPMVDKKPFLFSCGTRPITNPLFEPYLGIMKWRKGDDKEGTFVYKKTRYYGYNCTGKIISP